MMNQMGMMTQIIEWYVDQESTDQNRTQNFEKSRIGKICEIQDRTRTEFIRKIEDRKSEPLWIARVLIHF